MLFSTISTVVRMAQHLKIPPVAIKFIPVPVVNVLMLLQLPAQHRLGDQCMHTNVTLRTSLDDKVAFTVHAGETLRFASTMLWWLGHEKVIRISAINHGARTTDSPSR